MTTNHRMYPCTVPVLANEATMDRFSINRQINHGSGLFSHVPFQKGDLVFRFTGLVLPFQTLYSLQAGPEVYIHDPWVMGFVLHSCEPNMVVDMETRCFTAVKDIVANSYLTMDYETTEDVLFRPFACSCGSPHCRGWIAGKSVQQTKTDVPVAKRAAGFFHL